MDMAADFCRHNFGCNIFKDTTQLAEEEMRAKENPFEI